ncbi:hypothetical protein [Leuconostoc mesenteroides]|uniref:hypothetical protein n=1 Tax=Leuconostoc mesenteroides TaxID=1245 RepID=UPI001CBBF5AC|nr:hypothetical protein [Leuconostoc mesenteroides]MBZ1530707.1 hypothetical protein [Leuconostoc mesenteroides]
MTFEEEIENILNNEDYGAFGIDVDTVIGILEKLQKEYAPTVEMNKDKVKEVNSIVHEVGEEFEQDELPDDIRTTDKMIELESGFVLLKDLNVILHPETIKIVDE